MPDRLTGVEIFVRAIRLGSLSAAARERSITPAMAARHLSELEARLGVTLVQRTTRRLSLTESGSAYLDRAEAVLADLGAAEAEVSAKSMVVEGLLRVSVPATFGTLHVAPLVARFCARYPQVTVELGLSDRYVDLLEERWDTALRIGQLADSSLITRKLAPMHLCLCASPDYLSRRGVPTSPADLVEHECLGFTRGAATGTAQWAFGAAGNQWVPIGGSIHANNGDALIAAACASAGIVYGPRFIAAEAIGAGRLIEIDLGVDLAELGALYALTHPDRRPAAKTRAWLEFLRRSVPPMAHDW